MEPSYKNSYPPMGLMKIASYHNAKKDIVYFTKGMEEIEQQYDRIYITTLFTFYFDLTIKTINYYEEKYQCDIYVGGIASTIMYDKFKDSIHPRITILRGMLTDSEILGDNKHINIDELDMDYNILDQVDYNYKTNDGYISYTSRGCVNKCPFCAVPKLEPVLCITNNLQTQIENSKKKYGEKKDLLLLDNNILAFNENELSEIVKLIYNLGFTKENKFFGELAIEKIQRKIKYLKSIPGLEERVYSQYKALIELVESKLEGKKVLDEYPIDNENIVKKYQWIFKNSENILSEFKRMDKRRGRERIVDFNQGMDARLLTEEKMKILSQLPIKPFRLAFDHISLKNKYEAAIELAAQHGVKTFSNYLLYNFEDDYSELYERMQFNIELAHRLKINIHSFPMKFASIDLTHRNVVGKKWNKYFLSNYRRILKPTMGVVGVGRKYFYNAFGRNADEFKEILSMPYEMVTYRNIFRENGLYDKWRQEFIMLSSIEKDRILLELSNSNYSYDHEIMKYYRIRYDQPKTWKVLL